MSSMHFNQTTPRPDWVMLGMRDPAGDGVMLLASKQLSYAELSCEIDREDIRSCDFGAPIRSVTTGVRYELRAEMGTFVLIRARTYDEAFTHLFREWRPDDYRARAGQLPGRPTLPTGQPDRPGLPPGRPGPLAIRGT